VSTVIRPAENGGHLFEVSSREAGGGDQLWTLHASGRIQDGSPVKGTMEVAEIARRCADTLTPEEHYGSFLKRSIDYRGPFHTVKEVRRREGEAFGIISFEGVLPGAFNVHPGLLDACLQVMGAALPIAGPDAGVTFMPVGIESITVEGEPGTDVRSHAVMRKQDPADPDCRVADVVLADGKGMIWGKVNGLKVRRVDGTEAARLGVQDWIYMVEWQPSPRRETGAGSGVEGGRWVVIGDVGGYAAALCGEIESRGFDCTAVDAGDPDGFTRALGAIQKQAGRISRVVYAPKAAMAGDAPGELAGQKALCGCVVDCVRALADRKMDQPQQLWIVTHEAEQAAPGDRAAHDHTTLWGLGRSLAHEIPGFWGGLVDVDGSVAPARVIDEIERTGADDQIALRAGGRLVPRLVPVRRMASHAKPSCSAGGTYLITGGLGSLGLQLAGWLAGLGARHLVLTGRSAFPSREWWEKLASEGDARASSLLALEKSGVEVRVASADVSDIDSMREVIAAPGMPPLKGVVHAAGVVSPRNALEMTPADIEADMKPKVAGTVVLDQLTRDLPLDFFVMFSSASSIWGSKLLAGYGAANHFMDAVARERAAAGKPALSVNWAMWGGGGMAAGSEHDRFLQRSGLHPMPPEKAFLALETLISAGATQATVADVDWSVLKPVFEQEPRRRILERLNVAGAPGGGDESAKDAPALIKKLKELAGGEARREAVREFLREQSGEVLGLKASGVDRGRSLVSQGLDSLNANDLRGRIQKSLGVKVNVLSLLKGDSVDQLADRVYDQIAAALGEEPAQPDAVVGPDSETLGDDVNPEKAAPAREGEPRDVLLTGATGFLGVFVLADLLGRTGANVHCLVKASDDAAAVARIRDKLTEAGLWKEGMERRITGVAGDLSQPRFGVPIERWDSLCSVIDRIYHVGFVVNFLFSYEDLRPANVLSFIDIIRLATSTRLKPVHFVSSFSVLLTKEYAGKRVGEDEKLFPAEGGYREGKRACERLAGQARRRGLSVNIYRPPFIGWHRSTGYYNERDFLIKLIHGCLQLGWAPDLDVLFYITPVDYISSSIVRLSCDPGAANSNFNVLSSPVGIPWTVLVGMINEAGGTLKVEPFAGWRARLRKAGPQNPLHIFFPAMRDDMEERGSAVMDLFHRDSAPSEIGLGSLTGRLGQPPEDTAVNAAQMRAFIKRLI
jgi:thioester reductase-like protein